MPLSQATRCALLAATASVQRRCRRVFPTSALLAHDHTQTNEPRSESRLARALCMASRARRSRLHVRERESLRACRPKTFRVETFIVYIILTLFQHPAHCPATTHAQISVHTGGIARTRYIPVYTDSGIPVSGIMAGIAAAGATGEGRGQGPLHPARSKNISEVCVRDDRGARLHWVTSL